MTSRTASIVSCLAAVTFVATAVSCGADDTDLSPAAARGKSLSTNNGCASCHGSDGRGGVGPTWRGLTGSEVELADGSTVIADDEYLLRAIVDPMAEIVPGYAVNMPENSLTDDQALDIVAYINELADAE